MTLQNKRLLAQAYQAAWFAYSGQAIAVSVDEKGFFHVKHEKANVLLLPEWARKMNVTELLTSLSHLTINLAVRREKGD